MNARRSTSLSELFAVLAKKPVIDRVRVSRSVLTHDGALVPVRVAAFGIGYLRVQNGPWLFFWGRVNQMFWARADRERCTVTFRGLFGRAEQTHAIGPLLRPAPGRLVVGHADPAATALTDDQRTLPAPRRPVLRAFARDLSVRLSAATRRQTTIPQTRSPHLGTLRVHPIPLSATRAPLDIPLSLNEESA